MPNEVNQPSHAVAVFGGAVSGSTVTEILAQRGVQVVVFEQNPRPYGKIEDGLPRWHDKQRRMEYGKIDERLTQANVTYVPNTKLGRDLDFKEVYGWGWSAVLLANGAWKDRELDAPGAEGVVDRGLVYQNPFVYWFNHMNERAYDGPRYEVVDEAVVLGGGLASIDVIKIIQLELYASALRARGVEVSVLEMEHEGIPKYCAKHGVEDPASLGIKGALLIYRRRVEDMPLASPPANASEKQKAKIAMVRAKLLSKCQERFLFQVQPQTVTKEVIVEDGRLVGLVVQDTVVEGRSANPVEGSERELRTTMVISSIGSVPEPLEGVEMKGTYYKYKDWDTGEYAPLPGVFGVGNVVTGQGNIKASLEHGRAVGTHLVENYLGVGDPGERDLTQAYAKAEAKGAAAAEAVEAHLERVAPLPVERVNALLERATARQAQVGYEGDYSAWIAKVTPADME
jgi:NADPH-dependent glutamate synthase beta subunit-like oxidoreductase